MTLTHRLVSRNQNTKHMRKNRTTHGKLESKETEV